MRRVTTDTGEDHALALDSAPDSASRRDEFLIPPAVGGDFPMTAYLAGNSLGLGRGAAGAIPFGALGPLLGPAAHRRARSVA